MAQRLRHAIQTTLEIVPDDVDKEILKPQPGPHDEIFSPPWWPQPPRPDEDAP